MRKKECSGCVFFGLLLFAAFGFSETIITAENYAGDSDVVLESAVREIKSAPRDTINVIGDGVKYVVDETATAAKGARAVFKKNPREQIAQQGELAVANAWTTTNEIIFRSYEVSDIVGNELAQGADGMTDVSSAFVGIKFPKGTSACYRPGVNQLFVRQTPENMLKIEDMLAEQHNAQRELFGHQVEIETKMIEVSQHTLNELGFSWQFIEKSGGDAGLFDDLVLPAGQDVFTAGLRTSATAVGSGETPATLLVQKAGGSLRWNMIISALEQAEDSDVLCAPSIVTRDGNTATIEVGDRHMLPKSFSAKSQADYNYQNGSTFVQHDDWKSTLIGVSLEVTPSLLAGDLINLKLKPKVIDLIGYDEYQLTPSNAGLYGSWTRVTDSSYEKIAIDKNSSEGQSIIDYFKSIGGDVLASTAGTFLSWPYSQDMLKRAAMPVPELGAKLPYFRIRNMETRVTVADGSTMGMGGLIYDKLETFRDKVPVLGSIPLVGRLFRSEGERSVKRNLMIFVTATQVDINGRRSADLVLNK